MITFHSFCGFVREAPESYLDIKLEVALIHLPGNHTLYDLHWNQLEAVIGWAEDVMRLPLLDLQVQEPVSDTEMTLKTTFQSSGLLPFRKHI